MTQVDVIPDKYAKPDRRSDKSRSNALVGESFFPENEKHADKYFPVVTFVYCIPVKNQVLENTIYFTCWIRALFSGTYVAGQTNMAQFHLPLTQEY